MAEIELETVPSLASSYVAAALGSVRRVREVGQGALVTPGLLTRGVRVPPRTLASYQHLMGDTLRDTLPSVVLHGTLFPLTMAMMRRDDFPLPLAGLVHLSNEIRHRRPIAADEELELHVSAKDLRPHHAGTTVSVLGRVLVAGQEVFTTRSLYLAKGVRLAGVPRPDAEEHPDLEPPTPTARWRLDGATGRRYAAVLGDQNPIHTSVLGARLLGRPRPIAHGMYLAGRAMAAVAPRETGYAWDISFAAPVSLPGRVAFRADGGPDAGLRFLGWDERRRRPHFTGTLRSIS